MTTFADLGAPTHIVRTLTDRGITSPFPVQEALIPDGLAGRDISGRAPTGSGKTLAFGIPLIANLGRGRPGKPRGLVLAPTRELAEQIKDELLPLAKASKRWVTTVYGGVGYQPQRQAIRRGVDLVVACPGRLADLVQEGTVDLSEVDRIVVDEADRMSDMGFLPEVRRLLDLTSDDRQTWLFSATLDGDVDVLSKRYQHDPVVHDLGVDEEGTEARHVFWSVDHYDRIQHTIDVIEASGPTIVFCRTRHGADKVAKKLTNAGIVSRSIHGGRTQSQRQKALDAFSRGSVTALVATDVAARGIHVDNVAAVIHFDPTDDAKTYVHRSGRTARAGADGLVVSLVTREQRRDVGAIQRSVGLTGVFDEPVASELVTAGERAGSVTVSAAPSRGGNRGGRPQGGQRSRNSRGRSGRSNGQRRHRR